MVSSGKIPIYSLFLKALREDYEVVVKCHRHWENTKFHTNFIQLVVVQTYKLL